MRHATDADHVVAVTTIVSRQRGLRGALAIGEPGWVVLYLAIVGAGTVLGMMLLTTAMTLPLAAASRSSPSRHRSAPRGYSRSCSER